MVYNRPVSSDPSTDLARAQVEPDYLTSLPTRALQAVCRAAVTAPLDALLNRGAIRVDAGRRRIWRDVFWKGTFARNHWLGLDERLMTPTPPDGSAYSGGRFWKRFDTIDDGVARGHVVNFNIGALPGRPEVREVRYPDDRRRYIGAGDPVLLLTYLNPPYRFVYDLVKIVGPDTCVGVMHLGRFPRGLEFATFVLSRNNYPLVHMTVPDHDLLFAGGEARPPAPGELGGRWRGRAVFSAAPDRTLHNQFNPPGWSATFEASAERGTLRHGLVSRSVRAVPAGAVMRLEADGAYDEVRLIGSDTLVGRRRRGDAVTRRYVLTRMP